MTAGDIESLAVAVAGRDARDATLRAIDAIARERLGITMFSASICRRGSMEIERIFSSRPQLYPLGVLTNKRETQWGRQVLVQRKVFVGEGALEMAAAFDDQEAMQRAGVRSIINVPIVIRDECIAVLNFGRDNERVNPIVLIGARCLGLAATAAFAIEQCPPS